jgi:hypothetical protein
MTQFIQSLLGANKDENLFIAGLGQLEKMTGNSGIDSRFIADIIQKTHSIMRKLGLDIGDTTGDELYFTLNASVGSGLAESLLIDADYALILIDGQIISFNLIDVIENNHHGLPFGRHIVSHGQRSLRGELAARYINHARVNGDSAREIADRIGLIPSTGTCYTKSKRKRILVKESK